MDTGTLMTVVFIITIVWIMFAVWLADERRQKEEARARQEEFEKRMGWRTAASVLARQLNGDK